MLELFTALGLAIVIEGVCYALFPDAMKRMMHIVIVLPAHNLRMAGLAAAIFGVAVIWLIRG